MTNKIDEINNISINEEKTKALNEIKNNIDDAYSKEKINEKHYALLKEMASELEKKNNNDRK